MLFKSNKKNSRFDASDRPNDWCRKRWKVSDFISRAESIREWNELCINSVNRKHFASQKDKMLSFVKHTHTIIIDTVCPSLRVCKTKRSPNKNTKNRFAIALSIKTKYVNVGSNLLTNCVWQWNDLLQFLSIFYLSWPPFGPTAKRSKNIQFTEKKFEW